MKSKIQLIKQICFLTIITVFFASCGSKETSVEQTQEDSTHNESETSVEITEAQYKTVGITLGSPEMRSLSGVLKVNGFIDVPPQNLVSVTSQMGGIIKSTPLLQGSNVSKGQVIAVLENQEFVQLQQDYLESRSQLELTNSEYKRQQTLAQQNVNSQKTLQQAKANYQSALARENALKQRLRLININPGSLSAGNIRSQVSIYAPISGYVTEVNVNIGKFVNPNDIMFEIVNSSNLHVELNVFEKDAVKVKAGQQVRFTMTNDTTELRAVVQLVGGEINPDKTVTVHAIAKESKGFIPGTYLKAFIETASSEVLTLPQTAVVDFEGKKYIFVASQAATEVAPNHTEKENETETEKEKAGETFHFEMMEITTGISDGGYIEVQIPGNPDLTGKVVMKGAYDLLSKMKNSEEESGH